MSTLAPSYGVVALDRTNKTLTTSTLCPLLHLLGIIMVHFILSRNCRFVLRSSHQRGKSSTQRLSFHLKKNIPTSCCQNCKSTQECGKLTIRRCDLRLHREDYVPIPSPETVEPIFHYIEEIRFDPSRNRRLNAPPFLTLNLDSPTTERPDSVRYFLTRMDSRRELNRSFRGLPIVFGDIDGGDAWGRRMEVQMKLLDQGTSINISKSVEAVEAMIERGSG